MVNQHDLSEKKLRVWAKDHLAAIEPNQDIQIKRIEGGQSNPTFLITQDVFQCILRRKPIGDLLPSAHAIDREYRVIEALSQADFPVPQVYAYCQDPSIIGSEFYVMEFVDGRIFWDPRLPDLDPSERFDIFDQMNLTISKLHQIPPDSIGLGDYGRTGGYVQRQLERWSKQYMASQTEPIDAMHHLIEWLPKHIPINDPTSIVHGDFRIDNMIFHPKQSQVLAVLDWELSTLGNPISDFAYHMMAWRFPPELFRGLHGINFEEQQIPDEQSYLDSYLKRTGFKLNSDQEWEFYIVFNMFRMAAILQGVAHRAIQGNAASQQAIEMGKKARPIAELAWLQVQKLKE